MDRLNSVELHQAARRERDRLLGAWLARSARILLRRLRRSRISVAARPVAAPHVLHG